MTPDEYPGDSATDAPYTRPVDDANATVSGDVSNAHHEGEELSFVVTVLELLAEALDEDVLAMRPPLADVVDPEILASLRQSADQPVQTFTFTYRDCAVTVTNHGAVNVRRPPSHDSA